MFLNIESQLSRLFIIIAYLNFNPVLQFFISKLVARLNLPVCAHFIALT